MSEQHESDESMLPTALLEELLEQADESLNGPRSPESRRARLAVLGGWSDAQEWLKVTSELRTLEPNALGPELPSEMVALVFTALRRLEATPGSLTRDRVNAAINPDSSAMLDLARATDHALEQVRASRDAMRRELLLLRDELVAAVTQGKPMGHLEAVERLDRIRGL